MSLLAETGNVTIDVAPPCCDGHGTCDGESLLRLGASFTTGDLSLLSFSIPANQWKRPLPDQSQTKSIRVWYVVVAAESEGDTRLLTGILTGEARRRLSRRMETDNIKQMEPIKFTPRHVCGGILHQEAIKQRRIRLRDSKRNRSE
ncbi:MAG: hypothetical protein IID42_06515 [Planctomycetes bacterium]|nr:hypothetical protein [Planctomycetota bacterium]